MIVSGFAGGSVTPVNEAASGYGQAVQVTTAQNSANLNDNELFALGSAAVAANDTVVATFSIRTVNMGTTPGYAEFVVEGATSPYAQSVAWSVQATQNWQQIQVPFQMGAAYQSLFYSIQFWFPAGPQTVELALVSVQDFGQVSIESLNLPNYPYAGAAANASWRAAAAARIQQFRTGNASITVRDNQGRPVVNAPVHLKMLRHAFAFGSAADATWLGTVSSDGDTYRSTFLNNFEAGVLENDLKWPNWEDAPQTALFGLAWLQGSGIKQVRGNSLLWPQWQYMPPDVQNLQSYPSQVAQRVNTHLSSEVGAVQNLVSDWDVVNDPTPTDVLTPILGASALPGWYNTVRGLNPAAKLYLNEDGIADNGGLNLIQQQAYQKTLQYMINSGAALDGIGLEAHFTNQLTPPETLYSILNNLAAFNLNIKITEYDFSTLDDNLQAQYLTDFLTMAFSHPSVQGFYLWGFWAGRDYSPTSAMYNLDWTARPMVAAWQNLVFNQWWTDVTGVTNAQGVFSANVFYGDYTADTTVNGTDIINTMTFSPTSLTTTYTLGTFTPQPLSPNGILNAASQSRGAVAPGEQILIQTQSFAPEASLASTYSNSQLPTSSAGRTVLINGVAAPIVETTANSILAVVPGGLGSLATIQLNLFGTLTNTVSLPVSDAAPGVVTADGSGQGVAAAVNDAGSAIGTSNGAPVGSYVTIQITGAGMAAGVGAGQQVTTPVALTLPVSVTLNGVAAQVASAQWTQPGIASVRFAIPANVSGNANLLVTVANQSSQAGVTLPVGAS
jgi:uncharacterized protein (TIGR03437 family)